MGFHTNLGKLHNHGKEQEEVGFHHSDLRKVLKLLRKDKSVGNASVVAVEHITVVAKLYKGPDTAGQP